MQRFLVWRSLLLTIPLRTVMSGFRIFCHSPHIHCSPIKNLIKNRRGSDNNNNSRDCNLNGTCLTITYSDVRWFCRVVDLSFAEKLSIDRPRTWAFFVPHTLQKDLQHKDLTIQQQRVNTCRSRFGYTLIQMRSRALWLYFHPSPLDRNPTRALICWGDVNVRSWWLTE